MSITAFRNTENVAYITHHDKATQFQLVCTHRKLFAFVSTMHTYTQKIFSIYT